MDINLITLIQNILLVTVPALLVGIGIVTIIRNYIRRDQEMKLLEIRHAESKDTRMLRLQAYERLTLLLERIGPASVIARVMEPDMLNNELQYAMIRTIKAEYEHNLSQQLYVSSDAWHLITTAKDELIKAVGMIAGHMPADTNANQVARVMLESIAKSGQMLPNQTALEYLKNEARQLM